MKRRDFFKLGARKAAQVAYKVANDRATSRARNWIRPPFAVAELDFLIACTRCDQCIAACPHDVLFALPARLGIQVAGTPAMDLLVKGCQMCEGWPCVTACEPVALVTISLIQRRRAMAGKVRAAHANQRPVRHSEVGPGRAE